LPHFFDIPVRENQVFSVGREQNPEHYMLFPPYFPTVANPWKADATPFPKSTPSARVVAYICVRVSLLRFHQRASPRGQASSGVVFTFSSQLGLYQPDRYIPPPPAVFSQFSGILPANVMWPTVCYLSDASELGVKDCLKRNWDLTRTADRYSRGRTNYTFITEVR
jgi:hypothetical protein